MGMIRGWRTSIYGFIRCLMYGWAALINEKWGRKERVREQYSEVYMFILTPRGST